MSAMIRNEERLLEIENLLGPAAYKRPGVLIFQGDCLQLMSRLPDRLVDLTITSPPYNIGKEYETIVHRDLYLDWCEQWISRIHALTSPKGAFWLNLGYVSIDERARCIPIPYLLWDRIPFYLMQEIVWNYGAGVACRHMFSPRNEKFLWYVKDREDYTFDLDSVRDPNVKYPNQKKNGKLKCNPAGKNPTDVWQFPKVTSGESRSSVERTPHPAQFPITIIDRIVKACSTEYDLVLDPFMGSGTTAEAALRNGRTVIGFELRQDYVEILSKRLDSYFVERKHRGDQEELFDAI